MKNDIGVLISAGGIGSRCRPYSFYLPKALMPIKLNPTTTMPVIHAVINNIMSIIPVRKLFISVHPQHHDLIKAYLDQTHFGSRVYCYLVEEEPLGTGGALQLIWGEKDITDFMVVNADVYCHNFDYLTMHTFHKQTGSSITAAYTKRQLKYPFGVIETRENTLSLYQELVTDVKEKPTFIYNALLGIYFIHRGMLINMFADSKKPIAIDMPDLMRKTVIRGSRVVSGYHAKNVDWFDIGEDNEDT